MSSAEAPDRVARMTLERVMELDRPINRLGFVLTAAGKLLIVAELPDYHEVVFDPETGVSHDESATGETSWPLDYDARVTDGSVTVVWNGEEHTLDAHATPVTAFGRLVSGDPLYVTASEAGNIRVWDLPGGEQVRVAAQQSPVTAMVSYAGSDGRPRIASAGPSGTVHVWDTGLPAVPRPGPVSTRGFSDRVAPHDLLNRAVFVEALVQLLQPGEGDGPTVITVEGAWGSGKSTLLGFVRQKLDRGLDDVPIGRRLTVFGADRLLFRPPVRERPEAKVPHKPLVVPFNPWRHQSSEQVWAGLASVVAEAAGQAIMQDQNARERYWFSNNAARIDRRHLQRQLWKRIYSPLLSFAGLGFGVAALGALTKLNVGWAWWVTAGLAVLGLLHTGRRYFFGRASAFLPGELFAGPVLSNAFSGTAPDPLIRDPYYHAKSGYLYLVQHDVKALLEDLADQGYQVVLLIDDLDRCTPRTTAQVFEAINVFLADDFPATRFVLGLDTSVVASHVDHAYKELADAKVVAHPDDPSPGWTFLRKLVQLPVRLPRTTEDDVDTVLLVQLGPMHGDPDFDPATGPPDAPDITSTAERDLYRVADWPKIEEVVVAIERHTDVREHLRRRLKAQPEQSVREQKRLLNVWQFYLRVMGHSDVAQACHLVVVAEIAVRWPAYLHRLRGGWLDLADALDDDVRWGAAVAKLGYAYSDRKAAANLRDLLRDCDARDVARLADRLF